MLEKIKQFFKKEEQIGHKMILKSRCVKEGLYEVSGVFINATCHTEALNKWRRAKKETKGV